MERGGAKYPLFLKTGGRLDNTTSRSRLALHSLLRGRPAERTRIVVWLEVVTATPYAKQVGLISFTISNVGVVLDLPWARFSLPAWVSV